jgi:hypothetical protein
MSRVALAARLDALDLAAARVRGQMARVRGHKKDGPLVPKLPSALLAAWVEGWDAEDATITDAE